MQLRLGQMKIRIILVFCLLYIVSVFSYSQINVKNKIANSIHKKRLTIKALQNATYKTTKFDGKESYSTVKLTNGFIDEGFTEDSVWFNCYTQYLGQVWCDLNNDDTEDAIVLLAEKTGGTGYFISMYPVLNMRGSPLTLYPYYLGDRVIVRAITKKDSTINLSLRVQGPEDGACCPTKKETWKLLFKDGTFVKMEKNLP